MNFVLKNEDNSSSSFKKLEFYEDPPTTELSLMKFEKLCRERIAKYEQIERYSTFVSEKQFF